MTGAALQNRNGNRNSQITGMILLCFIENQFMIYPIIDSKLFYDKHFMPGTYIVTKILTFDLQKYN